MVTSTRILGPDGQPIRLADLSQPQTSKVGQLRAEWQNHPARGLTPAKLAAILLAAEQGDLIAQYELFEDMEERDGHILAELGKRRRAVAGRPWDVVPPDDATPQEKEAADRLKTLLDEVDDIEGALFDATDAIGKGFACQEIEWMRADGFWRPKSITHRPQSWFKLYRGVTQEIRLRDYSVDGAPLQSFGWIVHTHKARSGYLERANLFRALVWPYLFKNYSVGDLAEFLEIYGIPLRIGKFPSGASDKEKMTLLQALVNVGHNAAGIIPEGMSLDFHDTADGDAAAFELMMDWCERTESKVILGATLTSQADRGSNTNALGNVHNEVRKDLRDADAKQIGATLTRDLLYPLAVLNGLLPGGLRRCPRLVFDTSENKDLTVFASALPGLVGMGMRIKRSWAHAELGIPEAEDDADLLTAAPGFSPSPFPGGQASARAAARAVLPEAPDYADALAQALAARAGAITDGWLDQIRELVASAEDYDDLLGRLSQQFADLPLDALGDVLDGAMAASGLAGRYDTEREIGRA